MKKATLAFIMLFSFFAAVAQPQVDNSGVNNDSFLELTDDLPPDEDDDLNPNIPIDGGIVWVILSAIGIATTKMKKHMQKTDKVQ
ncbi:MAG: hypothetical protein MI784_06460 [Cytophagales bacterium]|nr:hypothetical protein [Cytophagales bacterium]